MIEVNYVAVLVAAVVAMVIGFLWYHPMVFGKQWMKEVGHTEESLKQTQKEMGKLYGLSFVLALITGYVLAHVMGLSQDFYGYSRVQTGLTSGFWMWLGFIMPVQLTDAIFGAKKWRLFGLNTAYQLVAILAMGLVLASL